MENQTHYEIKTPESKKPLTFNNILEAIQYRGIRNARNEMKGLEKEDLKIIEVVISRTEVKI